MIINGRKIAEEVIESLKEEISSKNLKLQLGAVLVGDDPEFKKFVELKGKAAEKVGVDFTIYKFSEEIKTEELIDNIKEVIEWSDGVLVELPLPKHIDQQVVLNAVPVNKDVDVLSEKAQGLYYENKSKINPPAVESLKIVLEENGIKIKDKTVAIFGYGNLIGKPIAHWMEVGGADVKVIRSKTENPDKISGEADIIVSGVGKPGLITDKMVQDGVVVIDFGYGKGEDGKMQGDVDFNSVLPKASLITPVPGGMGPILITAVLKNLLKLNSKN